MHEIFGQRDNIKRKTQIKELTSVGPPEFLHSMPHQHDARKLSERLNDVEVAQRADLKEGHAVLFCVGSCLLRWHLPLESKMKPVAHQDPGNTWGVLDKTNSKCQASKSKCFDAELGGNINKLDYTKGLCPEKKVHLK